jgi:hypothetical protein
LNGREGGERDNNLSFTANQQDRKTERHGETEKQRQRDREAENRETERQKDSETNLT